SAINVQIASRPLLCAARLRRKNPVPVPVVPPCAQVRQSVSALPTTPHVRTSSPVRSYLPTLPSAVFLLADAPSQLRPPPHTDPPTHTPACVECQAPPLLHLRFPLPIPGAPQLASTPLRTVMDSCSFVTYVLLIENCHHYLCLSFRMHSTGRSPHDSFQIGN